MALDLPGHGDSAWHDDADYRAETNAGAVAAALTQLAPDADAVVGQSLGGLTAIAVAAARPELVRRLVLVDISPGLVVEGGNQVRDFLAGPESFESRDEIVERAASFGFGVRGRHWSAACCTTRACATTVASCSSTTSPTSGGIDAPLGTDFRRCGRRSRGSGCPCCWSGGAAAS